MQQKPPAGSATSLTVTRLWACLPLSQLPAPQPGRKNDPRSIRTCTLSVVKTVETVPCYDAPQWGLGPG